MGRDFKIQRCITFYEKNSDEYVGDRILLEEELSLEELSSIIYYGNDDPLLYKQYEISQDLSKLILKKINFNFDFSKYDYFFETFSVNKDMKIGKGIRLKER